MLGSRLVVLYAEEGGEVRFLGRYIIRPIYIYRFLY